MLNIERGGTISRRWTFEPPWIYLAEGKPFLPGSVMDVLEPAVAGSANFRLSLSRTNSQTRFRWGTLVLISFLTQHVMAQQSADELAQKRAEQAASRTAIAFDSKQFDRYVGYYQLTPNAIFTITRDGDHFFGQLSGQPAFEVFPESAGKFFLKVVAAQISFDSDAAGKVTGLVLHQNGRELPAPRIDEAQAKRIEATRRPLGHPMPRNWAVLANITPRFLTSTTGGSDYWPCFSPDGKTVLFSRTTDGHDRQLLRVPVSGGTAENFTQSPLPVGVTRANWSARSNLIAFTGISADGSSATWVINSDGTGAHALSAAGLSDRMFYPSWYPDGARLVAMDGRNLVIKRVDLAGAAAVAITSRAQVLTGMPSVSPDGKWVAFAGQKNNGQPYDQEQNVIWLLSDGGAINTLEANPVQGRAPVWSPDGTHVAFESDRGSADGRYAIFVIGRDGTGLMQVTDYALNANHPVWSADGRRMVFRNVPWGRKCLRNRDHRSSKPLGSGSPSLPWE
jgi:Tol biopolymer transport system component